MFSIVNVVNDYLKSKISGVVRGTNETIDVSLEKDNSNLGVLRTVDAAPVAYDKNADQLKVRFDDVVEVYTRGQFLVREQVGNYTVEPGQSLRVQLPMIDALQVSFLLRPSNADTDHNVTLVLNPTLDGYRAPDYGQTLVSNKATQNRQMYTGRVDVTTNSYEIVITNHDTVAHNYDLHWHKFFAAKG